MVDEGELGLRSHKSERIARQVRASRMQGGQLLPLLMLKTPLLAAQMQEYLLHDII